MKKKGIINYGTKRSDRGPGGVWLSRGPYGSGGGIIGALGPVGFSINGGTRSAGYIGKTSAMSKNGTPYLGIFPRGSGGVNGRYPGGPGLLTPGGLSLGLPESKMNCPPARVITQGLQAGFIKPSVLSTRGMLETRFRYLRNGQYPNYWVQPVYPTGTQDDNASQWLYIQKKAAANICVNDTNKPEYMWVTLSVIRLDVALMHVVLFPIERVDNIGLMLRLILLGFIPNLLMCLKLVLNILYKFNSNVLILLVV